MKTTSHSRRTLTRRASYRFLRGRLATRLHEREGAATSIFAGAVASPDSELTQQITKDPYAHDFLAVDSDATDRELEVQLTARIFDTPRELGSHLPSCTFFRMSTNDSR
jgi:predicted nuclease of restriction endonuclease-like (RecB) superfamily